MRLTETQRRSESRCSGEKEFSKRVQNSTMVLEDGRFLLGQVIAAMRSRRKEFEWQMIG